MNHLIQSLRPTELDSSLWHLAGWTMCYFLVAGTVVAIAGALIRVGCVRVMPSVRYGVSLTTFIALTLLPLGIAGWLVHNVQTGSTNILPQQSSITELREPNLDLPSEREGATVDLLEIENLSSHPESGVFASETTDGIVIKPIAAGISFRPALEWLPWVWIVGAPLTFLLLATGLVGSARLRRQCEPIVSGTVVELCQQLQESLHVTRKVSIAVCERIAQPVLVGIVRPFILLPPAALTGWTPDEIEMVLLHELAHVRRWDNLVNLLQRIVESVLFFHPAVWLVSRQVRQDREQCCDAIVVARTARPQAYAELLLNIASQGEKSATLATASALADHPLAGRIRRILNLADEPMLVSRSTLGGFTLAAATLVAVMLWQPTARTVAEESLNAEKSEEILLTTEDTESTEGVEESRGNKTELWPQPFFATEFSSPHFKKEFASNREKEIYRDTQLSLIKSKFILNSVLRDERVAKLSFLKRVRDPLQWLKANLHVSFANESMVAQIALEGPAESKEQLSTIIDVVIERYQEELESQQKLVKQAEENVLLTVDDTENTEDETQQINLTAGDRVSTGEYILIFDSLVDSLIQSRVLGLHVEIEMKKNGIPGLSTIPGATPITMDSDLAQMMLCKHLFKTGDKNPLKTKVYLFPPDLQQFGRQATARIYDSMKKAGIYDSMKNDPNGPQIEIDQKLVNDGKAVRLTAPLAAHWWYQNSLQTILFALQADVDAAERYFLTTEVTESTEKKEKSLIVNTYEVRDIDHLSLLEWAKIANSNDDVSVRWGQELGNKIIIEATEEKHKQIAELLEISRRKNSDTSQQNYNFANQSEFVSPKYRKKELLLELRFAEKQYEQLLAQRNRLRAVDKAKSGSITQSEFQKIDLDISQAELQIEKLKLRLEAVAEQEEKQNASQMNRTKPPEALNLLAEERESTLLYDGMTFEEWRQMWRTELMTEKRTGCIKALAAFGRAGRAAEAAEAILDVAGEYDCLILESNAEGKLKKSIIEQLTKLPTSVWLEPLLARFQKDDERWYGLASHSFGKIKELDEPSRQIILELANTENKLQFEAEAAIVRSDLQLEHPETIDLARRILNGKQPIRVIELLRFSHLEQLPEQFDLFFHEDGNIRNWTRFIFATYGTKNTTAIFDRLIGVVNDPTQSEKHVYAIRAITAKNSDVDKRQVIDFLLKIAGEGDEQLLGPALTGLQKYLATSLGDVVTTILEDADLSEDRNELLRDEKKIQEIVEHDEEATKAINQSFGVGRGGGIF